MTHSDQSAAKASVHEEPHKTKPEGSMCDWLSSRAPALFALLGLNESKFSKVVESEAGALLGGSGVSHSLTPVRRGEALTHEQKQQLQDGIAAGKGAIELSRQSGSYPPEQRETILAIDRTFSAETALVAAGLKPLFHEQWAFQNAESKVFVEQIKRAFPHLEAEAWKDHVAVWNPAAVAEVMTIDPAHYGEDVRKAIHDAAESDAIGELLGNGARTRMDGNVTVNYLVEGEIIAGGFITTPELAESLGEQRRQAFEMAFGKPVEMQIRHSQKKTFSLSPVRRMELVENRLAVVLQKPHFKEGAA